MWRFLLPSFLLAVFGLFNLVGIKPYLVTNQIIYIGVGLAAFFIIRQIGIVFFRLHAVLAYIVFIILLIVTLIIGEDINGSRRWIDLGITNFQASELFKIIYILFLSDFLARYQRSLDKLQTFLILLASLAAPVLLIFQQPDLETAMFIGLIFVMICFFSPIKKTFLISLLLIGVLALPIGWLFLADYQKNRILTYIDPKVDPTGTAYNMTQSIITVGSGQIIGKGLGLGKQSTLFFLPENHTDFAYASLVEQFGFIGGVVVIILYMLIAIFLIHKIVTSVNERGEQSRFTLYYSIGFFVFFIFQVFVNIGMNLGLLPVSGTALPLISYGGSSLVTWMIGLSLLNAK